MDARDIYDLVQARVKRVLDFAEMAVPSDKFERFRTLVLNEFGQKGFQSDLARALKRGGPDGLDGHGLGRNDAGKKGGPMSG